MGDVGGLTEILWVVFLDGGKVMFISVFTVRDLKYSYSCKCEEEEEEEEVETILQKFV